MNYSFAQSQRIRHSWEYEFMKKEGEVFYSSAFLLSRKAFSDLNEEQRALFSSSFEENRFGIVVPKRVGSSVVRNRLKRFLREWFRYHQHQILPYSLSVLIVRPKASFLSSMELEKELQKLFFSKKLSQKN